MCGRLCHNAAIAELNTGFMDKELILFRFRRKTNAVSENRNYKRTIAGI